jgi:alcohol dehydrogenase class IV
MGKRLPSAMVKRMLANYGALDLDNFAMPSVIMRQVGRLAFGTGVATNVAADIVEDGLRAALIVTAPPVFSHAEAVGAAIADKGVEVVIWDDCDTEPSRSDLERLLAIARDLKADSIIGLGGGSSMDLAKLVAALMDGRQSFDEAAGPTGLTGRSTWLACIPTTAGTGSEVSPIAILLDESDQIKKGVVSPHLVPDAAYVDPLLMLSMPPAITAATGLDALTHCIEAYANRFAHPLIDTYALEGIRLIGGALLPAIRDGQDIASRTDMARASLYGGLCLGPVNTAAVHALAYPLGGEFGIPHGLSNALLLPHVLRFNLAAAPERYARIAVALGADPSGSIQAQAEEGLALVEQVCRDCGVPMRMRDHGVTAEALDRMADGAMTVSRLLDRNVRKVTWQDARRIYESAL